MADSGKCFIFEQNSVHVIFLSYQIINEACKVCKLSFQALLILPEKYSVN